MSKRLEPEPMARRDFLGIAGLWAATIAIVGSLIGMVKLIYPQLTPEVSKKFRIGWPDEFPPGTTQIVPERNVRIVSQSEGLAAVSLICTHLGCVVSETEDGFTCPCHGSKFGLQGQVLSGPAPRALRWLEVSRDPDGCLSVDTKREVPLGTFYQV